jgi:hypothetical protein
MPVLSTVAASLLAIASPQPRCALVESVLPATWACLETDRGLIVAGSSERAARLGALAAQGATRFRAAFNRPVPLYAIVETIDGRTDPRVETALKVGGVAWRMPWLSEHDMAEGFRTSITRGVTAKAKEMQLDADRTAALVASALAQQADKITPASLQAREAGALPHELGHGWFINAFWPDASIRTSDHYGGPAPDWMDETAAVLMEDDTMANSRRAGFAAIYAGEDAAAKARLLDLTAFLSGGHPALPKLDTGLSADRVQVLTGEEGARIAASARGFYLQARLFADYVLARSGDPAAFRSAADAFAKRKTTTDWLAADGRRLHLPTTVGGVQADWLAWLAQHTLKSPT